MKEIDPDAEYYHLDKHSDEFELFQGKWCPLFGELPFGGKASKSSSIVSACLEVIRIARQLWNSHERDEWYDATADCEWVEGSKAYPPATLLTFYPSEKLTKARNLAGAWRPSALLSVRRSLIRDYNVTYEETATLWFDEVASWPSEKLAAVLWTKVQGLIPAEMFSLIAAIEAWELLRKLCCYKRPERTPEMFSTIRGIELLLARASNEERMQTSKDQEARLIEIQPIYETERKVREGVVKSRQKSQENHARWIKEAEKIRSRDSQQKKLLPVAKEICKILLQEGQVDKEKWMTTTNTIHRFLLSHYSKR